MRDSAIATKCLLLDLDGVVNFTQKDLGGQWYSRSEIDIGIAPDHVERRFFQLYWRDVVTGQCDLEAALHSFLQSNGYSHAPRQIMEYWFEKDCNINDCLLAWIRLCRA